MDKFKFGKGGIVMQIKYVASDSMTVQGKKKKFMSDMVKSGISESKEAVMVIGCCLKKVMCL